jgi:hypothetical protein
MADYAGPGIVSVNARPSLDCQSITINRISNAKPVKTLALGLAGKTKGAPEVEITVKYGRRVTGDETDWKLLAMTQDDLNISVVQANEEELFVAWVVSCSSNSEVDTEAMLDVTLHGRRLSAHTF